MWFTILYNMVRLAFFRRDSNDSHFRSRMMAVSDDGRSASSFTKHCVEAYIRSTVYVDIISCWSLIYGVYDGGK